MKTETLNTEKFSWTHITSKSSELSLLHITIDLPTSIAPDAAYGLFGDFLLSGTKQYSREAFQDKLNKLGADIEITTEDSLVHISVSATKDTFGESLALFVEAFKNPAFRKSELLRLQTVARNQYEDQNENAKLLARRQFINALYKKGDRHHVSLPVDQKKQLDGLQIDDFKKLYKAMTSHFVQATSTCSKNGKKLVESTLAVIAPKKTEVLVPKVLPTTTSKLLLTHSIPSKQNIEFSIGSKLPFTLQHPDYHAFVFGLSVLGVMGGFTGRLMSTVREKEGLTYGIYATTEGFYSNEPGYWRVLTFFAPDKTIQALTSTFREIKAIAEKGVTKEEFRRFKVILKTRQSFSRDSIVAYTQLIHQSKVRGISVSELQVFQKKLLEVSLKDVNAALKKYLRPKELIISGAGPVKSITKELAGFNKKLR